MQSVGAQEFVAALTIVVQDAPGNTTIGKGLMAVAALFRTEDT